MFAVYIGKLKTLKCHISKKKKKKKKKNNVCNKYRKCKNLKISYI